MAGANIRFRPIADIRVASMTVVLLSGAFSLGSDCLAERR
jgi:hypothetical protein